MRSFLVDYVVFVALARKQDNVALARAFKRVFYGFLARNHGNVVFAPFRYAAYPKL